MDDEIVEEGIDDLRRRAEGGDAVAMRLLAGRLRWDDDVPRDERLALKWLKRAAELNEPEACYELAEAYRYGSCGLRPNAAKAFFYHTRASELGDLESAYVLAFEYLYHGRLAELNPAKGAQLLKTVAEAGFNSDAMFWYAVSCVNALGVPRDLQTARFWLRRCLEKALAILMPPGSSRKSRPSWAENDWRYFFSSGVRGLPVSASTAYVPKLGRRWRISH